MAGTTMTVGPQTINAHIDGRVGIDPGSPYPDAGRFKVNVPGVMEVISQPLYDYQLYPAAGATQLTFFQTPVGQGTKTRQDTNMELAGQLPAPQLFLIEGIAVDYLPGLTAAAPVIFGAQAATGQANDVFAILRAGQARLVIGSKEYFTMSPLLQLPPRAHLGSSFGAADGGANAVTVQQLRMNVAFAEGPVYMPIPMLLEASQNFRVELNWAAAIATATGDALARIGVQLYGTLYRPAQ